MKFEHLVQINDPRDPLITPLSRAELWRGLLLRAEQPEPFMHGLDNCAILERSNKHLQRELRFGTVIIRDRIELVPEESLVYAIAADSTQPGGQLAITIEEPAPEQLFVRFAYQTHHADDALSTEERAYLEEAYHAADLDAIGLIRRFAEEGRLTPHALQ